MNLVNPVFVVGFFVGKILAGFCAGLSQTRGKWDVRVKKSSCIKGNDERFGFANHTVIQKTSVKSLYVTFSSLRFEHGNTVGGGESWRKLECFSQVIHNAFPTLGK
jgi:hypothetical protein